MKKVKVFGVFSAVIALAGAAWSFGEEAGRAVFNAKQLGIEDLDLGLDFGGDAPAPLTNAVPVAPTPLADEDTVAEPAAPAVEPAAAPADDFIALDGVTAPEAPAPAADAVVEAVLDAVAPVAVVPAADDAGLSIDDDAFAPAAPAPAADAVVEAVLDAAPAVAPVAVAPAADDVGLSLDDAFAPAAPAPAADAVVEAVLDAAPAAAPVAVAPAADAVAEEAIPGAAPAADDDFALDIAPAAAPVAVAIEEIPAVEEVPVAVPVVVADAIPLDDADASGDSASVALESTQVADIAPPEAPADSDYAQMLAEIDAEHVARTRLYTKHGTECIAVGTAALESGSWDRAIEKFTEALGFIAERKDTLGLRREALAKLAEATYRKALEVRRSGDRNAALVLAREAARNGHPKAVDLVSAVQNEIENPPPPPAPVHERRWVQPEYKKNIEDIKARMNIAKEFYATGEYTKARAIAELILKDYPDYQDAANLLRRIALKEHDYAALKQMTTRAGMIKDVADSWTPNRWGIDFLDTRLAPAGGADSGGGQTTTTQEAKVLEKMRNIVIPEIDFREANITDVITFLSEASREYDAQNVPAEERGVNIVLNLGAAGGSAPSSSSGSADIFSAAPAPVASSGGISPLTITVRFSTLLNALNLVTEMASLKYVVRDNVVMIMPENAPEGNLIHRMYNVLPTIIDRKPSIASLGASNNDPFSPTIQAGTVEMNTDWKAMFSELGVVWPDGSTIQYMQNIGKLVVLNTAQNLARLESVLAVLNVVPKQVQIEVRFVEVMQTDLDSLGFEWNLDDDWEVAEMKADSGLPPGARRRVQMGSGSFTRGFNYLSQNTALAVNNANPIADNIASITSILTNPQLTMVLHMLSSRKNSDLLSAPKVVTQSGAKATIKVVTEYIYPTEYNVEMLESSNNSGNTSTTTYTGAVVEPQNFIMREVGVILEVTPEVTPDGEMINLTLTPSVVSEPTWKNYGSTYPVQTQSGVDLLGNPIFDTEYVQLPMEQPFFPVRSLATTVQIYNGATVVMGGMITEERITNEDKIPFLGDLPLVGFLFRNKYEQSVKRNLLLFVTAKLIDPNGRTINTGTDDAMNLMTQK